MTTATIEGKRVTISIYEKARMLSVYEVPGQSGYTVSSGSEPHKAYRVSADCQHCGCDAYGICSHRIAAQSYKDAKSQPVVLFSEICGHRVKCNVYRHCGCMA